MSSYLRPLLDTEQDFKRIDTRRLRTARSNALSHGRFDVVRRIDTILRYRAQNPDAPHNLTGRPFKPYKASRNWHPAVRALWVKCNEEKITRHELAKRTGYSIGVIYKWSLRPQVMSITRLIDLLHAVGLDLAAVTPTTVALDAHHPEVAQL